MRYFKRIKDNSLPLIDVDKIYKENEICWEDNFLATKLSVKNSVKSSPYNWKEVSEIEYIKQQGWYIKGSEQFEEWLKNQKYFKHTGWRGHSKYQYYYLKDGKLESIFYLNTDKLKDKIEVTVDQLNEIYNNSLNVTDTGESFTVSFKKQNDMANFSVKINKVTFDILQELAFKNGYGWTISGTAKIEFKHRYTYMNFEKNKYIHRSVAADYTELSLEETINRITTKKELFKEGDWVYINNGSKGEGALVKYTNNIHTHGFRFGSGWTNSFNIANSKKWEFEFTKATDEEVKSALIKEAKRRGFPAKRWNSPNGALQFNSNLDDSWTYNSEVDKLRNNSGLVYQNGKWAEIVDEPKEIFGFPVDYTEAGFVQFGCSHHRYRINELERFISTLRNVKAQTTVGELLSELRDVLKY